MNFLRIFLTGFFIIIIIFSIQAIEVEKWDKAELTFESNREYGNPIYDVNEFRAIFTSPTGREISINGFWDGGLSWKIIDPGKRLKL